VWKWTAGTRTRAESALQLLLQELVHLRRIGLAAGRLHDLADEVAEELLLAGAVLLELLRVLREHLVDRLLDRAGVGDLLEPLALDDGVGVALAVPHRLEHVLGDLAGDRVVREPL